MSVVGKDLAVFFYTNSLTRGFGQIKHTSNQHHSQACFWLSVLYLQEQKNHILIWN